MKTDWYMYHAYKVNSEQKDLFIDVPVYEYDNWFWKLLGYERKKAYERHFIGNKDNWLDVTGIGWENVSRKEERELNKIWDNWVKTSGE